MALRKIPGVILGFAFMIGSASSKYFEVNTSTVERALCLYLPFLIHFVQGLLFILVRRPFQIGDGISISNVNEYALPSGNPFWIVEDVDLFTTKVMYFFSCERATLNNGSLASSRVINSTLSTFPKGKRFRTFSRHMSIEASIGVSKLTIVFFLSGYYSKISAVGVV